MYVAIAKTEGTATVPPCSDLCAGLINTVPPCSDLRAGLINSASKCSYDSSYSYMCKISCECMHA